MSIFKPCDIRGKYPAELDENTALSLGRAVGAKIQHEEILVGGDVRLSTNDLKESLIKGLLESGSRVIDIGRVPTPVFYFARHTMGIHNGIMVTASHNPAIYNGFKITLGESPIEEDELWKLSRDMENNLFNPQAGGSRKNIDVLDSYLEFLIRAYQKELVSIEDVFGPRNVARDQSTIVVDCGNGATSLIAMDVFRALGFKIVELFCEPDGAFPNRDPNPAVAGNLKALQRKVVESQSLLGVAFDGDGDRVAFVDSQGESIPMDSAIALFSRYFTSKTKGAGIVFDIKCSSIVSEEINRNGGKPIMERSGHTYLRSTLLKENALFGGELSGHCFFGSFGWDDPLFAALIFTEIILRSAPEIHKCFPRYYSTPDLRIHYHDDDKQELLDELLAYHKENQHFSIATLDGVRAATQDGWALCRISVTEPLFTFRFEGNSKDALYRVMEDFLHPIPKLYNLVKNYCMEHPSLNIHLKDLSVPTRQ